MNTVRSRSSGLLAALVLVGSAALGAPEASAPDTAEMLSAGETLVRAKENVAKMQDTLREILQLQEQAKKQKDIIRLNCVNDKLMQLKGHLAVADTAMGSLNEAIAKGDDGARQHEYQRVSILRQKVLVLATEARNCVGDDLSYVGEVDRQLWIDPNIPQKDYTAFDFPTVDTTRPPVASSF